MCLAQGQNTVMLVRLEPAALRSRVKHSTTEGLRSPIQWVNHTVQSLNNAPGDKIFQYCTCPTGRVKYNFHSSCKHMHLSFKSVCNKEHKGVICNMTSTSYSSQSTHPTGLLDFTRNYERRSGIFVPCAIFGVHWNGLCYKRIVL